MSKTTLPVAPNNPQLSTTVNANFKKIETALNDKVLWRDNPAGEPNQLKQDLDLNGNDIMNVNSVHADTLVLDGVDYVDVLASIASDTENLYLQTVTTKDEALSAASAASVSAVAAAAFAQDADDTAEEFASVAEQQATVAATAAAITAVASSTAEAAGYANAASVSAAKAEVISSRVETGLGAPGDVFSTVAAAVYAVTENPDLYTRVQIIERANSYWDVVTGETPDGYGVISAGGNQLKLAADGRVSSLCYGIPAGNSVSQNAAVKSFLSRGGQLLFEAGDYLLTNQGVDTDAVSLANYTKNLDVVCAPGANFIIDNVDGDGIRISVPGNGSGVPEFGQTILWKGGRFDQTGQKNSTTMPFLTEYPPANPGTTATADALSIRGEYNDGTEKNAIVYCEVSEVETYAGTHWEIAGGDSGIFVSGCKKQVIHHCYGTGNRDLNIYTSGSELGTLPCHTEIYSNTSINCFHGVAAKRSSSGWITMNHAENCARAVLADYITGVGSGFDQFQIVGNTSVSCGMSVRAQRCNNFIIKNNRGTNAGAFLADGTTIESYAGGESFRLEGCYQGIVSDNSMLGVNSGYLAAYPSTGALLYTDSNGGVASSFINFDNNRGDGLARCGLDNGSDNSFIGNVVYNATVSSRLTVSGTRCYEIAIDPTNNGRIHRNRILCADGELTAPSVARSSQPSVGVRFATNAAHMTINNADRVSASNVGVGFNGETPITKPTISGSTGGNSVLQQVVAALDAYGLVNNSTT